MPGPTPPLRRLLTWWSCLFLAVAAWTASVHSAERLPQPLDSPHLEHLFQVTPGLYSGAQPEDDAAFAELARLGIKTIVSVDGTKPDLELARRYGLRYVHLPFGYDGIPTNRVPELARAAQLPGPIYVHCHHGLHRGPAAVAVMCLAAENWNPAQAGAWLKQAGTSTNYPGLYRAAREFQMPEARSVAALTNLPEVSETSTLVEAMVVIDGHFDRLKEVRTAGWKAPPTHPDVTPAHETTMLWEQFRELARQTDTANRPPDYREQVAAAEKAANALGAALKASAGHPDPAVETAFQDLGRTCAACHKRHRN